MSPPHIPSFQQKQESKTNLLTNINLRSNSLKLSSSKNIKNPQQHLSIPLPLDSCLRRNDRTCLFINHLMWLIFLTFLLNSSVILKQQSIVILVENRNYSYFTFTLSFLYIFFIFSLASYFSSNSLPLLKIRTGGRVV